MMKTNDFTSDPEIRALVLAFETGSLGLSEFNHTAHLTVALTYLADKSLPAATTQMRTGLHRFLAYHGQSAGYHETLTLFWMRLLDHVVRRRHSRLPLWQRVNAVVGSHGGSWPVQAHYSRERTSSAAARQHWVAPDLLPLPF